MDQVCPVCRQQQQSWSHLCLEQRYVVHAEMYRDFLQNSNPLDRLPHDDYMEIMWGDAARLVLRRIDNYLLEEEVLYFVNPLIYRVEINPIATVLGFRGTLSGIAIEVDGHEDCHWDEVLQALTGPPSLRCGSCAGGRPTSAAWCPITGRGCPTCGRSGCWSTSMGRAGRS